MMTGPNKFSRRICGNLNRNIEYHIELEHLETWTTLYKSPMVFSSTSMNIMQTVIAKRC
jgi:hypothetical protein